MLNCNKIKMCILSKNVFHTKRKDSWYDNFSFLVFFKKFSPRVIVCIKLLYADLLKNYKQFLLFKIKTTHLKILKKNTLNLNVHIYTLSFRIQGQTISWTLKTINFESIM